MLAEVLNTFVYRMIGMKYLLLLIWWFSLPYCTVSQEAINKIDANGMKTGRWVSRYPGGTLKYEGSFEQNKPVGQWKRYHENGKVKALMSYRPHSDRVFASLFDDEGNLYAKGVFVGSLRDSTWNFYDGSQLLMIENYHLGKREGKATGFYKDGKVRWEKWWKADLAEGKAIEYDPAGIVKSEIFYKADKKNGPAIFYDEKGAKNVEGAYKDDLSDGTWKIYDIGGKLKYQVKYDKGEILNKGTLDTLQINEFKKYDKVKGKIPEPKANETGFP